MIADNTTSDGFELLTVLAELDGVGYPISFLLLRPKGDTRTKSGQKKRRGARLNLMESWFDRLKRNGLNPDTFLFDKDFSEISAVRRVWPRANQQLCWWHVKHAVQQRMDKGPPDKPVYHFDDVKKFVPDADPTFVPPGCRGGGLAPRDGATFAATTNPVSSQTDAVNPLPTTADVTNQPPPTAEPTNLPTPSASVLPNVSVNVPGTPVFARLTGVSTTGFRLRVVLMPYLQNPDATLKGSNAPEFVEQLGIADDVDDTWGENATLDSDAGDQPRKKAGKPVRTCNSPNSTRI